MENDLDALVEMVGSFQETMKRYLPEIRQNINWIIKHKSSDIKLIESHLDTLLSLRDIGLGEDEFYKLNDYYSTVHIENSKTYADYYLND